MAKKYVQNRSSVSRHTVFLERRFLQIKASLNDASDGRIGEEWSQWAFLPPKYLFQGWRARISSAIEQLQQSDKSVLEFPINVRFGFVEVLRASCPESADPKMEIIYCTVKRINGSNESVVLCIYFVYLSCVIVYMSDRNRRPDIKSSPGRLRQVQPPCLTLSGQQNDIK